MKNTRAKSWKSKGGSASNFWNKKTIIAILILLVVCSGIGASIFLIKKQKVENFDWKADIQTFIADYAATDRTSCGAKRCLELCDNNALLRGDNSLPQIYKIGNEWYIRVPGGIAKINNTPPSLNNIYTIQNLFKPGTNDYITSYYNKDPKAFSKCPKVADLSVPKPTDEKKRIAYESAANYFRQLMKILTPNDHAKQITGGDVRTAAVQASIAREQELQAAAALKQAQLDEALKLGDNKTLRLYNKEFNSYWVDKGQYIPEHEAGGAYSSATNKYGRVDVLSINDIKTIGKTSMPVKFRLQTEIPPGGTTNTTFLAFWNTYNGKIYRLYDADGKRRFALAWDNMCLINVPSSDGKEQMDINAYFAFVPVEGQKNTYNIITPFMFTIKTISIGINRSDKRLVKIDGIIDKWEVKLE